VTAILLYLHICLHHYNKVKFIHYQYLEFIVLFISVFDKKIFSQIRKRLKKLIVKWLNGRSPGNFSLYFFFVHLLRANLYIGRSIVKKIIAFVMCTQCVCAYWPILAIRLIICYILLVLLNTAPADGAVFIYCSGGRSSD